MKTLGAGKGDGRQRIYLLQYASLPVLGIVLVSRQVFNLAATGVHTFSWTFGSGLVDI